MEISLCVEFASKKTCPCRGGWYLPVTKAALHACCVQFETRLLLGQLITRQLATSSQLWKRTHCNCLARVCAALPSAAEIRTGCGLHARLSQLLSFVRLRLVLTPSRRIRRFLLGGRQRGAGHLVHACPAGPRRRERRPWPSCRRNSSHGEPYSWWSRHRKWLGIFAAQPRT